jgi:hypothetical protein
LICLSLGKEYITSLSSEVEMLNRRFESASIRGESIHNELKEIDYRVRNESAMLMDLLQEKEMLSAIHEVLFLLLEYTYFFLFHRNQRTKISSGE